MKVTQSPEFIKFVCGKALKLQSVSLIPVEIILCQESHREITANV